MYESEHTKFMRALLEQHPEWVEDQRKGRAIWWDKKNDQGELKSFGAAREPHRSYPYDVNFDQQ